MTTTIDNTTDTAPTLTVLPDLLQGTDEWHDQRRGLVTASAVHNLITTRKLTGAEYHCTACGAPAHEPCRSKTKAGATIKTLHPERAETARTSPSPIVFETAKDDTSRGFTALLATERITGWTNATFISDDMLRGMEDEPRARAKYAEHFAPVTETGFMVREQHGIKIGYSPDGLVGDDGLIEIKSRQPKIHLQHILADKAPAENMAQLQCGLLVSGREWIDYVSYCAGMPLWVKRVYPDQQWFDAIINAVNAFEETADTMIRLYKEAVIGLPTTIRELTEMSF